MASHDGKIVIENNVGQRVRFLAIFGGIIQRRAGRGFQARRKMLHPVLRFVAPFVAPWIAIPYKRARQCSTVAAYSGGGTTITQGPDVIFLPQRLPFH